MNKETRTWLTGVLLLIWVEFNFYILKGKEMQWYVSLLLIIIACLSLRLILKTIDK